MLEGHQLQLMQQVIIVIFNLCILQMSVPVSSILISDAFSLPGSLGNPAAVFAVDIVCDNLPAEML